MKKYFSLLTLLLITLYSSAQNQARFIPATSFIVTEFNLKSLYEKGNLEEIKKLEIWQVFEKETARELDERYEASKVLWNNPAATGVDLNGFAYFYVSFPTDETLKQPYVGLIFPIKDAAKMDDYLLNKFDIDRKSKVQKIGKMKMVSQSGNVFIWGGDVAMLISIPNDPNASYPEFNIEASDKENEKAWADYELKRAEWNKKQATLIAASTPSGSILQEQHFRDLHAKNYDLGLYVHNTEAASQSMLGAFLSGFSYGGSSTLHNSAIFDNHYTCTGLLFEKGAITLASQSYYSPRLAQYIDPIYNTRFNPSLLRYINSKESIAFTTMSFSMPALKKVLKEKADTLTTAAEKQFARTVYAKEIKRDQQVQTYMEQQNALDSKMDEVYGYAADSAAPAADYTTTEEYDQVAAVDSTVASDEYYSEPPIDYEYIATLRDQRDSIQTLINKRSEELGIILMKKDGFDPSWIWDITGGDMVFSFDELYPEIKSYEYQDIDPETYETVMKTKTYTTAYPHYTAVMSIADKTKAEKLLTILTKQGYLKNKGSYYSVVVPGDGKHEHFLYLSNGNLVITNNSKLAVLNKDGFQDGRGYDPILAARCQENVMLFRFNTDILMSSFEKTETSTRDLAAFNLIKTYMGAFEADGGKVQQGQHQGKASLEFGNTQEFSLLQLFRFSNELYLIHNKQ